jgi:DNA-binding NarL/FixJ family response regulator
MVEDHPIVVTGIVAALRAEGDMEVVGVAGSIASARELLAGMSPDVLLLDLRLPDGSGIDLLREVSDGGDGPSVLVLSSFMTTEYVSAAVALGASGFLLKTTASPEIIAAIRQVAGGGIAFTADQLRESRTASWAPLTRAEHAVLDALLRSLTNDEIATELGVSRKAIEAHLTRLFARYNVLSRTELALVIDRRALLDLPTRSRSVHS